MLKSKRDESIKRYLARVGKLEHNSKMYNYRYYRVSYGESLEIVIRFSDHFNGEVKTKPDIDVIKTSIGFYTIKTNSGMSATLTEDTIIPYLRSLLIVYPEVSSSISSFMNAAQYAEKQMVSKTGEIKKVEAELKRRSEDFNLADSIWDENKKLTSDNKTLKSTVELQKKQYADLKSAHTALKAKHQQLLTALQKLQAFKSAWDNVLKNT